MPLYLVTDKQAPEGAEARTLVDADNPAQARNRVADDRFDVTNFRDYGAAMRMRDEGVPFVTAEADAPAGDGGDV